MEIAFQRHSHAGQTMTQARIDADRIIVKGITLHHVCVPLREPFRISNGEVVEKRAVLVEVRTAAGVTGWGESSPMPGSFYSADTPDSVWTALCKKLIPRVLHNNVIEAPRFFRRLREVAGEPFAKAGLEGALWDAYALQLNIPLHRLLGIATRMVPSGVAIGIYDQVGALLERVERYVGEGYRRVKIKIQPGWDEEPVAAVRERFPDVSLTVDANGAYSINDAAVFRRLDSCGLTMIEQPLAREAYSEAAELQRELRTPLCADESAESLDAVDRLIALRAARILNIKIQRVGGLSESLQMLARARAAGLGCWVGTMPELGIASAQGLHLAAHDDFTFPTDIEASARWYVDDIIEPAIAIDGEGFIHLPPGPGTGFQVSRSKVERYTIATEEFKC
jgi:O-succinylbenzoate synthase